MTRTYFHNHCRFLSAQLLGALTGLMILFGAAETAWADEPVPPAEEAAAVSAELSAVTELTPEELSVSVTVEADLELPEELAGEIGPGIGMAPEGFGSGGLPNTDDSLLEGLKQFLAEDGIAVFSTQVENEGSDLSVYEVGRIAQSLPGVVEGKDMTAEAIITKLMWALGQTDDVEICKQLFIRPIQFDRLVL